MKPIALRLRDSDLQRRVTNLSLEQHHSLSLTCEMLIAYAFNQIDQTGKTFKPKLVFSLEDKTPQNGSIEPKHAIMIENSFVNPTESKEMLIAPEDAVKVSPDTLLMKTDVQLQKKLNNRGRKIIEASERSIKKRKESPSPKKVSISPRDSICPHNRKYKDCWEIACVTFSRMHQ